MIRVCLVEDQTLVRQGIQLGYFFIVNPSLQKFKGGKSKN